MVVESRCLTCGKQFIPRSNGGKPQVRCSEACRRKSASAAQRRRQAPDRLKECVECGGPVVQMEIGRPRRFCSDECKTRCGNRQLRRRRQPVGKPAERPCIHCGKTFQPKRRDRTYCYDGWCHQAAYQKRRANGDAGRMVPHEVACGECGTTFTAIHPRARWCSKACQIRHRGRSESRRRGPARDGDRPYADREIFERDRWTCHLCGKRISKTAKRTGPDGATIDHLVPLSLGGSDEPANVAAAHRRCNNEKRARAVGEQLCIL